MNKRGQDLSLTTIILAALGMIILVVLVAVFTGQTGRFNLGLDRFSGNAECNTACNLDTSGLYSGGSFKAECSADTEAEISVAAEAPEGRSKCCCLKKS